MSVFDLHPEDLLDREVAGELLDHERALLEAHLHHCVSCRLERQVKKDFALEQDAELPAHTGALVMRALESQKPVATPDEAVLEQVADHSQKQAPNHSDSDDARGELENDDNEIVVRIPSRRARAMRRRVGAAVIAAAVLMLASVAVAARGSQVWTAIFAPAETAGNVEAPVATAPAPVAPKKHNRQHAAPDSITESSNTDDAKDDVDEDDETAAPVVLATPPPTACAPVPQPIAPSAPVANLVVASNHGISRVETTPAIMFADATSARRRGDHVVAARLYRDLIEKDGASAEAPAARIALGRMLLDDGDADGALTIFRGYLAGGDVPLREEAMDGRARALERTHRADEERAAWNDLVTSYPDSVHKAHAEARLLELSQH